MRNAWGGSGGRIIVSAVLSAFVGALILAAPAFAALEAPVTDAPTAIGGTSVTFNGTLNPGASGEAGYYFMYAGGTESCEGTTTKPGAEKAGKAIPVSAQGTKLEALTEYTYCVVATHLEGETQETAEGTLRTFKTLASAPVIEGGEVSGLTPTSASVFALIDPENQATSCVFEYGETPSFGNVVPCEPEELQGAGQQFVPANFTKLAPGTTYHYRVVVENETGETAGPEGEFTTVALKPPEVENESVTNVTSTSAKIEAQVNPNYQKSTYVFEYATNEALTGATVVPGAGSFGEEFGFQSVSTTISGLQPRTVYYYRVSATNGSGTQHGAVVSPFETLGAPIATISPAQEITRTTANVTGSVDPGGTQTWAQIGYIDQADYEVAVQKGEDPYEAEGARMTPTIGVPGVEYKAFGLGTIELRELKAGTTYRFVVIATNAEGTTTSQEATFNTSPAIPPVVTTGEAVGVTQTSATLTGTVDTRGLQTRMSFEMGGTPALGLPEQASVVSGSESGTTVSIELPFANYLPPGTTFYYRACATNADGTNCGAVKTFTTATFSMPPTYSAQSFPLLPVPKVPPPGKTSGSGSGKKHSGSSKKLGKALKACAKKPKSKRSECRREARSKYGKKG